MKAIIMVRALISAAAALLFFACVTTPPPPTPETPTPAPAEKLPPAEQEQKALGVFEEMLAMTADVDRTEVLPQLESGYLKVINEYPDSEFAQESYWFLIRMYLDDYTPPLTGEAEMLYGEYKMKHPDSGLKVILDDTMIRFFYRNYLWEKLIEYTTPAVKGFIQTGSLNGPFYLFLYSEAKMNTGDAPEAEKGYKIIMQMFPSSKEALVSKDRLKELGMKTR